MDRLAPIAPYLFDFVVPNPALEFTLAFTGAFAGYVLPWGRISFWLATSCCGVSGRCG